MPGPLAGLRVADFTRVIAGPMCSLTLADLGAEVVKIEHPQGGDDSRGYRPPELHGLSPAFIALNRNKRSVALDLGKPEALRVARALADRADIVLENFSGRVMKNFGLDYATLSADRPRLIYCSMSAYGREGPFADRAGYDPVVQAESGYMSQTGDPEVGPLRTGIPMIDVLTGVNAAQGVLAAVYHLRRTGQGQYIEVPLFDTGFSLTAQASLTYLASGVSGGPHGNGSENTQPTGAFRATDGSFFLAVASDRVWQRLAADVLDRPDLAADPRFATSANRVAAREELGAVLRPIFAGDTRDAWVARMRQAGVPAGEIREISEAFASPETKARGLLGEAPHPRLGKVPNIGNPIRLSKTPVRAPVGAPLLGQDTEAALADWLGYGPDDIAALRAAGATP